MSSQTSFSDNEFVLYKERDPDDDKKTITRGGGFSVNSILLNQNIPIMGSIMADSKSGANIFENLAVPLCMFHDKFNVHPTRGQNICNEIKHNRTVIGDDIYDELLNLVTPTIHKKTKSIKPKKTQTKTRKFRKSA